MNQNSNKTGKVKKQKTFGSLDFFLFFIYLCFILLLFWKVLTWKSVFSYGFDDGTLILHPMRYLFAKGESLWTTRIFCGFSIFAEPHMALFYPLNWLLFKILPVEVAFGYLVVLELVLAGFFTYLYARLMSLKEFPSFISAVTFSLLGFMPSYFGNSTVIHSSVWLPAVFYFLERNLKEKRLSFLVFAGFFLTFQILSGFPQMAFVTILGAAFYYFLRFFQERIFLNKKEKSKLALFFLFFLLFAGGLAAVQILPTYELTEFSPREAGLSFTKATEGSWSPANILTFFFPYFFKGLPAQIGVAGLNYLGALPLILVFFSWLGRKDTNVKALWALTAFSLFLALGYFNLFYRLIYFLPGFITFRAPSRFFLLAQFSLSILAGFGYAFFLEKGLAGKKEKFLKLFTFGLIFLLLIFLASNLFLSLARPWLTDFGRSYIKAKFYGQPDHPYSLEHYYQRLEKFYTQIQSTLNPTSPQIYIPVVLFFSALILPWLKLKGKLGLPLFERLAVLLLLIDVFIFFSQGNLFPSVKREDFVRKPAVNDVLKKDRSLFRIYSYPHWEHREGWIKEAALQGNFLLPLNFGKETLQPNLNILSEQDSVSGYIGLFPAKISRLINLWEIEGNFSDKERLEILQRRYLKLLSLLNVKYILTRDSLSSKNLEKVYENKEVRVYRNNLCLPRFFLVPDYQVLKGNEVLKEVISADFQPQRVVLLESEPEIRKFKPFKNGNLELISYKNTEIKLKVYLDGDGFLFLSQNFYPGWKAMVNGEETPIYRANYAFQALLLKSGENEVKLIFQPLPLKEGAIVSFLSLIIGLGIISLDFVYLGRLKK